MGKKSSKDKEKKKAEHLDAPAPSTDAASAAPAVLPDDETLQQARLLEGTAGKYVDAKEKNGRIPLWIDRGQIAYELELKRLQIELMKLQKHIKTTGQRILVIFEGRDAAGKGGTIKRITDNLNPRGCRVVALAKPSDYESTQWYFQRYVPHLPAGGELVLFDRSWYNRTMVEPVMGFCTDEQHKRFLKAVPLFEELLVKDGINLFKFYFSVSKEEQAKRFEARETDPLKQYKLSPVDNLAQEFWDQYTIKKFQMLQETNRTIAPWTIVRSNDKKRARINCMKSILAAMEYEGKLSAEELRPDGEIIVSGIDELHYMEEHLFSPERLHG